MSWWSNLKTLFAAPENQAAHALYIALVARARNPFFYTDCQVPDTLDGRFDLILLHLALEVEKLEKIGTEESKRLHRAVLEIFVRDMDRSLREMGVGDLSVGKRVGKMSEALFGRLRAYKDAFAGGRKLEEVLLTNVYAHKPPATAAMAALMAHIEAARKQS